MEKGATYGKAELARLHELLYEILAEVVRVCNKHDIPFFMIGGSAIGVYYWEGIVPFDDDIDVGMTRESYERFLAVAPAELDSRYCLQCHATEPNMPYYFAKVRRNGTRYVEAVTKDLPIHQGIFVDIIPFDKVPDHQGAERWQWKAANFVYEVLQAAEYQSDTFVHPKADRILAALLPKSVWIWLLRRIQTWYDRCDKAWYNNVMIRNDHIPAEDLRHLKPARFGPVSVFVPDHLEEYLRRHYPKLKKHLSDEEMASYAHAPLELSFTDPENPACGTCR